MMAPMAWRRLVGDARAHGLSLGWIALVLLLGTAATVATLHAQAILQREIANSFAQAQVPDLALLCDRVTPEMLVEVAAHPEVAAVDARRTIVTRVQAGDGSWMPMRLHIVSDLAAQKLGLVHLHQGDWSGQDGSLWLEQSGAPLIAAALGNALQLRSPQGEVRSVRLGGFAHDTAVAPSVQDRMIYAYANSTTAAQLGFASQPDQLLVRLRARAGYAQTLAVGNALLAGLQSHGQAVQRVEVLPATHPHALLMQTTLRVLGVLSVLAVLCSAALAGALLAAWMRREIRQIGILKTLGARSWQLALHSLLLVGPVVLLATSGGLVVGAALARLWVRDYAVTLNIDVAQWQVPHAVWLREILLTLGVPLLAMAWPVLRAARASALSAIQDSGIALPPHVGRWAAMVLRVPGHTTWTLALRNTWRRPWRLALITLALTLGGTLVLTTHSNYESLVAMVDTRLAEQGHDVEVLLQQPAAPAELEAIARSVAGVEIAEAWRRAGVHLVAPNTSVAAQGPQRFALTAYPDGSQLFKLPVVAGRLPAPLAADEVLVTRALQNAQPQLQVGSTAAVQYHERTATVRVVGVVEEVAMPLMYAPVATFEAVTALGAQASAVRVKASAAAALPLLASALDQAFLQAHRVPAQVIPRSMVREALEEHIKVVGDVVQMVALVAAMVGAIVLAATAALGVIERQRETGILRTLGATPARLGALLLAESGSVLLCSGALSIALALGLTRVLLNAAERSLVQVALPMQFSWLGLAILCSGALVVLLMVALALGLALRKSVRATLAYD